jgi:hypothetical protein
VIQIERKGKEARFDQAYAQSHCSLRLHYPLHNDAAPKPKRAQRANHEGFLLRVGTPQSEYSLHPCKLRDHARTSVDASVGRSRGPSPLAPRQTGTNSGGRVSSRTGPASDLRR